MGLSVVEDREVKAGVGDGFDFDDFSVCDREAKDYGRRPRGARQLYGHIASSKMVIYQILRTQRTYVRFQR